MIIKTVLKPCFGKWYTTAPWFFKHSHAMGQEDSLGVSVASLFLRSCISYISIAFFCHLNCFKCMVLWHLYNVFYSLSKYPKALQAV